MRRTQPSTDAKISSTTHVQLLQWLHGKQQQHEALAPEVVAGAGQRNVVYGDVCEPVHP